MSTYFNVQLMQFMQFLLVSESRKMSQEKKNQDFGNIFSFPSYSQKTDDGELVFTNLFIISNFYRICMGFYVINRNLMQ